MKSLPRLATLALTAVAALTATAASAQNMKPGLWELTSKMSSSSGQMEQAMAQAQQAMAKMPPEQRKKMEEMMAKQGVAMGASGPAGTSVKICMTKEMVERNELPAQNQGDCKTTMSPRVGNTMKMTYACTNPPSSGEGEFTYVSNEAYTSKMTTISTVQGKPEKMTMDASGKWLSADCGAIKPMAPPPAPAKK
jgi:Protein of unknown function (DUF3617)